MADLILPDPRMEMPELFEPGRKPNGPVVINTDSGLAPDAMLIAADLRDIVTNKSVENYNGNVTNSGGHYVFNGSNALIKLQNLSHMQWENLALNEFSITLKFRGPSQTDGYLFSWGSSASGFFRIYTSTTQIVANGNISLDSVWGNTVTTTSGPMDGNWHVVTVTAKENSFLRIYIDGVLEASANRSANNDITDPTPYIAMGALIRGTAPNGQLFYNGDIESMLFYNRELGAAEISRSHNHLYGSGDTPVLIPA